MHKKGLFSNIFTLLMLVFLTPSIFVFDSSLALFSLNSHVNQLSLSADMLVIDALVDVSRDGCKIKEAVLYKDKIENYLENLISDTDTSSITCSIVLEDFSLTTKTFSGSFVIGCNSFTAQDSFFISKTIWFEKSLDVEEDALTGSCIIRVNDEFDGESYFDFTVN